MAQINIQNLTFAYDDETIFEDVSFQMDTDWKLGFIGRNGRGKTTFLNLLLKKYPYSGKITAPTAFEYFPYPVPDKSQPTRAILEQIADLPLWQLQRELNLLEVNEDVLHRPFSTLSNGEQTKVLLAALFLKKNSFLLIDEPTSYLDMHGRRLVSRYLRKKKGFIVVSHDRAFLDGCIDHILAINRTNIEIQQGNFSSWLQNKEYQDHFETAENEKLKKEIRRLQEAAKEKAAWSEKAEKTKYASKNAGIKPADRGYIGHKAAKMMKRAKAMEKRRENAIEKKEQLLNNIESTEELKLVQLMHHTKTLARLQNVSIAFNEKMVCQNINFTIEQGDRIALLGKNGSGKSSLCKLLCGQNIPYTGTLHIASGLKIAYVPQDASFLKGSLAQYARENDIDESLFKTILRKLDFSRPLLEKDMAAYSAGQKKKVLLSGGLARKTHLLLLDEALEFVDIFSRLQIEKLFQKEKPTLLFVEHDRAFCEAVATKTILL